MGGRVDASMKLNAAWEGAQTTAGVATHLDA